MKRYLTADRVTILVLIGFLRGCLLGGPAYTMAGSSNHPVAVIGNTIQACVGSALVTPTVKLGGRDLPPDTILRVIGSNQTCATNETELDWNIQGPQGQTGPQGLPGTSLNPQQIALLRWYEANRVGITYTVGIGPQSVVFDGANIWIANYGGNSVTKLRARDGLLLGTYPVGANPDGIVFDGTSIWVTNSFDNTVTKLNASDGSVAGTYPVGNVPSGIAFDGANIWVGNTASNTLTKLKASDGSLVGTYQAGGSYGIAFDGINIWATNQAGNSVTELRASDGSLVGSYPVGPNPIGITFDGANIWVANSGSTNGTGTISKL